ncbi:MAG: DUF1194 domain-containing protein [Pseudomonadota bacterium]
MRILPAAALALLAPLPAQACGVALALMIDVSGSVDTAEYRLQMGGLSAALRDGLVADALIAEEAAVTVVQWSGKSRQAVVVPWRRLDSIEAADAFAAAVDAAPRAWRNYSTGIGEALLFTANLFAKVPECERRVIDVSGDGKSNEGSDPSDLRDALAASGFVINGLAIRSDVDDLGAYYRAAVIAGEAAFVMTANGFDDYPKVIKRKLIREVTKQVAQAD